MILKINFYLFQWGEDEEEERPPLKEWLCIEKLAVCCHDGHYGPECKPCQIMDEDKVICSGNGKCKGAGTRKGNGKCACDAAYTGEACNECAQGYYSSYQGMICCYNCSFFKIY